MRQLPRATPRDRPFGAQLAGMVATRGAVGRQAGMGAVMVALGPPTVPRPVGILGSKDSLHLCRGCGRRLPRGWFDRNGGDLLVGGRRHSRCRECRKPGKASAAATRRTRIMGRGTYTAKDVRVIYRVQDGRCALCRRALHMEYHVDHIVPIAKGGWNVFDNLQLLCPRCNLTKGAKL